MEKKKEAWKKIDTINLILLGILFVGIIFGILWKKGGYLFGSTTDWPSQHVIIPEYFRTLFLQTKDFFPNFAFQLGGGQNIYNFSYYGLFNPIVILSYFLPIQNMYNYLTVTTCLLILASVWMFYKFLRNHHFNPSISLLSSIIFMCASPLFYHAHRHLMFINYMPFLILGLMGVDAYFEKKKSWLLSLGTFLMILMSYYYSVVGIIVLVLYGIYQYLARTEKITIKSFFLDGIKAVCPILIGILSTGILLVPTFLAILSGRGELNVQVSFLELLLPNIHLNYVLYRSYGVGLGVIAIFAVISLFFQKREEKFLGCVLSALILFPIINYIFNATMYIDAKSLIPFTPLYAFSIALFLRGIGEKSFKLKPCIGITLIILVLGVFSLSSYVPLFLFDTLMVLIGILLFSKYLKGKISFLGKMLLVISSLTITVSVSRGDALAKKETYFGTSYQNEKALVDEVTKRDSSIYRITNQIFPLANVNRTFQNDHYYTSTLYASTYNQNYHDFYYDIVNNAVQSRNTLIVSAPKNYPFLLLTGNKYLLTETTPFIGYQKIDKKGKQSLYQIDNALPLAFASSHLVSQEDFEKIGYPYNQDILLKNIIVKKGNTKAISNIKEIDLKLDLKELEKLNGKEENGVYTFSLKKKTNISLPLEEPIQNKLLYIRFRFLESNSCDIGDTEIIINNIGNKLTCSSWKYHNQNYTFDYVLAFDQIDKLEITLSKGNYQLTDFEFYTLDYDTIQNLNQNIDPFQFDYNKTKGDDIVGDITVKEDGYFVLSVPYDQGFKIEVDGKKQDYEKTNIAFVGFPITKGNYHIEITYQAPGSKLGLLLSILGILLFTVMIIYEQKKEND